MINKDIETVISVLLEWKNDYSEFDGGVWKRYNNLEKETKIKKFLLRSIMIALLKAGIIYTPTMNRDGQINGTGYFLQDRFQSKTCSQIIEEFNNKNKEKIIFKRYEKG